jgi:uroporphyrinogen decarboxylase
MSSDPIRNIKSRLARALTAMNHQEPDRVPLDFGGRQTTVHYQTHQELMDYLGFKGPEPHIRNLHTSIVDPDPQLLEYFDAMSAIIYPKAPDSFQMHIDPATNTWYDEWGVKYYMPPGGYYYDMCENPLPNATSAADLARYAWPKADDPTRITGLKERLQVAWEAGDKVVYYCSPTNGLFEHSWYVLGFENAYTSLAGNQPLIEAFTERLLEWQMAYWSMALEGCGQWVDVIQLNEDLGSQNALLMAPATYRKIYKPRLRRLIEHIHKMTDARIYLHSCGAVRPLIGDMIEIGVDILNPVQVTAKGMDSAELKREFGRDITFWGGGCSPVILQNGTVEDVEAEVRRRIRDFAPGGGFVLGSVHNIQAGTPPQNIVAMFEAGKKWGGYPIQA